MITGIITATLLVGIVGLLVGLFLGIAGIKFKVEVDEREEMVLNALPGNNCGGCGYPGCSGLAAAIVKGEAKVNACPVGGETVGQNIAAIMGVEADAGKKMVAFVKCQGNCEKTHKIYEYSGNEDCGNLKFVPAGGPKSCDHGCLGYGNCVKACKFDAIHVIDGIAVVDKDKCKSCNACVEACPKKLIELVPYENDIRVACSSIDKGPVVMKACSVGCIGCGLCVKNCPSQAIKVENFVAKIDYDLCIGCEACIEKCPKKAIIRA